MAYHKENKVDYFPHIARHGRKMFILRNKFGNDGYTVWFMILEELAQANNHHICLRDDMQLMYLSAKMMVSKEVLIQIVDLLAELNEFDKIIWKTFGVIWCEKFNESIADVYKRRTGIMLTRKEIGEHYSKLCQHNSQTGQHNVDTFQQSRVEKIKVDEIKVEEREKKGKKSSLSPAEKRIQEVTQDMHWLEAREVCMSDDAKNILEGIKYSFRIKDAADFNNRLEKFCLKTESKPHEYKFQTEKQIFAAFKGYLMSWEANKKQDDKRNSNNDSSLRPSGIIPDAGGFGEL